MDELLDGSGTDRDFSAEGGRRADGDNPPQTLLGSDKAEDGADPGGTDDTKNDTGDETPVAKNSGGDTPADGDGSRKETDKTDQEPEPLVLCAPEGLEHYQDAFDSFAADMDPWLRANPDAAPKAVLAEAARRQAHRVTHETRANAEAFEAQLKSWENAAKADTEIGGDDYEANVAVAVKAIEAFGSQELKNVLNQSGLGNHPALIRFAVKAGQQLREAPVLKGTTTQTMSLSDALYGTTET